MPATATSCIGRFAPSPTGPLHLGSLLAAVASYLDARHRGGRWLLRMDDLDPPREQPGAARLILDSLQAHDLAWDGEVLWQGTRAEAYDTALRQLRGEGLLFRCDCSRAQLGPGGACDGQCRERQAQVREPYAWRVRVPTPCPVEFDDRIQGTVRCRLDREAGDFIVRRKDGLYAYQLAVVVDDAYQGITDVVRGADLLDSTPRQIHLQRLLGLATPRYAHIPVLTGDDGQKLSKQTGAAPLEDHNAAENLRLTLDLLGQPPPPRALRVPADILAFAVEHWSVAAIAGHASVALHRPPTGFTAG
jgi:glutamyl-Q tRNA(Asp) synthetase